VTGWATRLDVTKGESPQDCVPPAPAVRLTAEPSDVVAGQSTTLSWTSDFAGSCTASGAWTGSRNTSGSEAVGPLQSNSLFILICNGPSGATRAEFLVVVGAGSTVGLSIADQTQPEGNSGSSPMLFLVSIDRATSEAVSFAYQTAPGTANAGNDYTSTSGNTQIPAGSTSVTISVPIIGDTVVEPNETFTVQLTGTSPNAQIVRGTATGTILDDGDVPEPSTTAGIWFGSFVDGVGGSSIPVKAIVTETGEARFLIGDGSKAGGQVFGTVPTTGTDIKVNLTGVFYPENYWSNN
jgi:hypothetical protein